MNKVVLVARLTKDPEVRYTQNNNIYATFGLAVRKRFKVEGGADADFINIIAWGKTAEFVSMYFKKGMQIALVGRLQTRSYEANDGSKRYVTEVVAEEVEFAESKKQEVKAEDNEFSVEVEEEIDFTDLDQEEFKM